MKKNSTKKPRPARTSDGMRKHYDFSEGVRGKHSNGHDPRLVRAVILEPDVAKMFPDAESVNSALRLLAALASAATPARRKAG